MNDTEIKKLVSESFLPEENKKYLLEYISVKGIDIGFFNIFNEYLIKETEKRGEQYKKLTKKLSEMSVELDQETTKEKEEIEKNIEKRLSFIKPEDLNSKSRVWTEYYDLLDKLGKKHENGLKDILFKITKETN